MPDVWEAGLHAVKAFVCVSVDGYLTDAQVVDASTHRKALEDYVELGGGKIADEIIYVIDPVTRECRQYETKQSLRVVEVK